MLLLADAHNLADETSALRHAIHREPEIGLDLPKTQEKILGFLDGLPLEISLGRRCSSITALLRGTLHPDVPPGERPSVLLRADMDALPLQEQSGVPYSSRTDGIMHACGHDLHTSMLAGAARLLAERRHLLTHDVIFMFQPGEEGYDGAKIMIEEGVLDSSGRHPDAAYGLHVQSAGNPLGHFVTKPGVMTSASDGLFVTVHGAGGHGSAPHLAQDPVTVLAEMATALQVLITRQFDIFDPVVVSIGVLAAGTSRTIIPSTATFEATVRTFSHESRQGIQAAIRKLLRNIAHAHGVEVDIDYRREYPPTINTLDQTAHARHTIEELFGDDRHSELARPWSASEDFSRILELVPGAFIGLSAAPSGQDPHTLHFNHSPEAVFDDDVLADGAALYAQLALTAQRTGHPTAPHTRSAQNRDTGTEVLSS